MNFKVSREKGVPSLQLQTVNEEYGNDRSDDMDPNSVLEKSLNAKERVIEQYMNEIKIECTAQ